MAATKRIPFDKLVIEISGEVPNTLEEAKELLVVTAYQELKKVQATGALKSPKVLVDGKPGVPVQNVKFGGHIIFFEPSQEIKEVAIRGITYARSISPHDSGEYRRNHRVMINGTVYRPEDVSDNLWERAPEIFLFNQTPYSRKIESYIKSATVRVSRRRGITTLKKTNKKYWSDQAAKGVYRPTTNYLRRIYAPLVRAKILTIEFGYRTVNPDVTYKLKDRRYQGTVIRRNNL